MWKVLRFLALGAAVLSVASLVYIGFAVNRTGPFVLMLTYYESILQVLFSPVEPLLITILSKISNWLNFDPELFEHWRHVLVPMLLFVTSDVKLDLARRRYPSTIATVLFGYPIAMLASGLSGTAPLDNPNMLAIIWAIFGFVVYQLFRAVLGTVFHPHKDKTRVSTFLHFFWRFPFMDGAIGLVVVVTGQVARESGFFVPNLVLLFVFVIMVAIKNIVQPAIFSARTTDDFDEFRRKYLTLATPRSGREILAVILGGFIFVAINAGLNALGIGATS